MKRLLLDIETAPNTAHVWGLWDQRIGLPQILESSYTLCWSAKWYGTREVMFDSRFISSNKKMLKGIHKLLEEADAVIHYNGNKFDIPTLNKEFLLEGMRPPAPAKQIDLLRVCRSRFRFPSNRLDYVANALGLGKKKKTDHKLWVDCMKNDSVAWKKMEAYNKHDVRLLERVYDRVLPWIKGHPNTSLYEADLVCPNCGSHKYQRRGYSLTQTAKYIRHQCSDCGTWFRGGRSVAKGPNEKFVSI